MKKRTEDKYRFYFWDYLWWTGERLHEYNYRCTGVDMLLMYVTFFICIPVLFLRFSVDGSLSIFVMASYIILVIVSLIWPEKIYGRRRSKAVMKHYADRYFNPARGYLLFFLPVIFMVGVEIIYSVMAVNQSPQVSAESNREAIHKLMEYIKTDSTHVRRQAFRYNGEP